MNLRDRRAAAKLTQTDVAKFLGLSTSQYSRYESSPHMIKMGVARKLATLFNCEPGEISGLSPAPGDKLATYRRIVIVYDLSRTGEKRAQVGEYAPSTAVSREAYGIQVSGDAMVGTNGRHAICDGDWLVIDPLVEPKPGSIVHAIDPSTGEEIIRLYIPLHPSNPRAPGFILRAANAAYDEILISSDHEKPAILGVAVERRSVL